MNFFCLADHCIKLFSCKISLTSQNLIQNISKFCTKMFFKKAIFSFRKCWCFIHNVWYVVEKYISFPVRKTNINGVFVSNLSVKHANILDFNFVLPNTTKNKNKTYDNFFIFTLNNRLYSLTISRTLTLLGIETGNWKSPGEHVIVRSMNAYITTKHTPFRIIYR